MVGQRFPKPRVAGSNPARRASQSLYHEEFQGLPPSLSFFILPFCHQIVTILVIVSKIPGLSRVDSLLKEGQRPLLLID